jgi:ABC-type amino acid transport substrate-binding protein
VRSSSLLLAGLWLAAACGVAASQDRGLPDILQRGAIRVALYNGLPPFSHAGRGIDVDVAEALAGKLGVALAPLWFDADENMTDDLRNMVWKGHYLGAGPADVMMHAPVDRDYTDANRRVRFVAPYFVERFDIARDARRVPRLDSLEVFASEAIAVESDTWPDSMMLAADGGRYRSNVVHFRTASEAVASLRAGRVSAVLARRSELEAGLNGVPHVEIAAAPLPGGSREWTVGLAVKAEHAALASALQQAMSELEAEGALARIFARHGVRRVPPGAAGIKASASPRASP